MKKTKAQIMKERAMKGFAHFGIESVKVGKEVIKTKKLCKTKK